MSPRFIALWKRLPGKAQLLPGPLIAVGAATLGTAVFDRRIARVEVSGLTEAIQPPGGSDFVVGLAFTWAAAEHPSAGRQVPLAIPGAVLHLLAMAVWLADLLALAVALFRAPADRVVPVAAVAWIFRPAFAAVVVLVATGLYQSWRQAGPFGALSTTEYGRFPTLKIGTVVLVLTTAAFSRH